MLIFVLAVFFLLITPGPGVLSIAGVGAAYGRLAGYRYLVGLFLGSNLVALAVVSGVAALALAEPLIRNVLLVASVGYLLYLAWRIAFAGSDIAFIENERPPGVAGGLLLQAINPKAYVVNTTLFTGFAFEGLSLGAETAWKFVLVNLVWVPIHLLWLAAGIALRRLSLSPRRQRAINVAMGVSLVIVAALASFAGGA